MGCVGMGTRAGLGERTGHVKAEMEYIKAGRDKEGRREIAWVWRAERRVRRGCIRLDSIGKEAGGTVWDRDRLDGRERVGSARDWTRLDRKGG